MPFCLYLSSTYLTYRKQPGLPWLVPSTSCGRCRPSQSFCIDVSLTYVYVSFLIRIPKGAEEKKHPTFYYVFFLSPRWGILKPSKKTGRKMFFDRFISCPKSQPATTYQVRSININSLFLIRNGGGCGCVFSFCFRVPLRTALFPRNILFLENDTVSGEKVICTPGCASFEIRTPHPQHPPLTDST